MASKPFLWPVSRAGIRVLVLLSCVFAVVLLGSNLLASSYGGFCSSSPGRYDTRISALGNGNLSKDSSVNSSSSWQSRCSSDFPVTDHLRIRTIPLDFQWLAINAQADNVSLLGPDGHPTKLVRLGKELSLLNNSVYKFEVEQSGVYELYDSGQPLSRFSLHPSDCYCPQGIEQFLSRYECQKDMIEHVKASMERWPFRSITREMFEQQTGLHYSDTVLQFAVLDNKLYCRKVVGFDKCPFPDEEQEFDFSLRLVVHLIQSVLRKVKLPDVAFFWNFDDGPHQDHYIDAFQPLFSASASDFHGGNYAHSNHSIFSEQ
jgi:hypothetical protein